MRRDMDDSAPVSSVEVAPDPVLAALARLEQRLSLIEERIDRIALTTPGVAAVAVDSFDDAARALQARGVDLDERIRNATITLDRLTTNEATQFVARALDLAQNAPLALATFMDGLDQHLGELHDSGVDLEARLKILAKIAERLTTPAALGMAETLVEHLPNLERLMSSGLLSPGPLDIVSKAGDALTRAQQAAPAPVGAFGLLRALSDDGVRHALGFALTFLGNFGRSMQPTPAGRRLRSETVRV
ncbi:MAG: hypothetical protein RL701_6344 [Pseudomonadota bacterium]